MPGVRGVFDNLTDIAADQFPDYIHPADYAHITAECVRYPEHWLIGDLPGFAFNIARNLRKLDQYLSANAFC